MTLSIDGMETAVCEPPASPELIIGALAPHVTPARYRRMLAVAAVRTRRLTAILERFNDPHNVAACARTAEGLGLQALHTVPAPPPSASSWRSPRPPELTMGDTGLEETAGHTPTPSVSMRAERWLEITGHSSIGSAIEGLRLDGFRIVAATLDPRARTLAALPMTEPVAVIFGSEKQGVTAEALARADDLVGFPMRGFAQSFNVSVAFALIMGELRTRLELELPYATWSLSNADRTAVVARWLLRSVRSAQAILQRAGLATPPGS